MSVYSQSTVGKTLYDALAELSAGDEMSDEQKQEHFSEEQTTQVQDIFHKVIQKRIQDVSTTFKVRVSAFNPSALTALSQGTVRAYQNCEGIWQLTVDNMAWYSDRYQLAESKVRIKATEAKKNRAV
jgi:hypothetical protein